MVVDAGDRHAARAHRVREVAEAAEIRDVEDDDDVGVLQLLHGAGARVRALGQEEVEAVRHGCRVGDDGLHAAGAQQMPEAHFAPQPVAIGVDVGGEDDAASR